MSESDFRFFQLLKKDISTKVRETYPENGENIQSWKGDEITNFQEDLIKNVSGRISEKWFYTHIKTNNDHIPRIDILNLLCSYIGYKNWIDFKAQNSTKEGKEGSKRKKQSKVYWVGIALLFIVAYLGIAKVTDTNKSYQFKFLDSYSNRQADYSIIKVMQVSKDQSAKLLKANNKGYFSIDTDDETISFTVQSAYYKSDTITRILGNNSEKESILLRPDDYTIMLKIFSSSKVEDWAVRRRQLNDMFSDNAYIYQISDVGNIGMELYNKEEFIKKLTTPIKSLKNIEVIEAIYNGNRIKELRFKQNKL